MRASPTGMGVIKTYVYAHALIFQRQCDEAKKTASIPPAISTSGEEYSECQQYDISDIDFYPGIETVNITNGTTACDNGWVYDTSQYQSTIITEVRY